MEELQYHEQRDLKNKKKLQELLAALPPFCADFFRGIEPATSSMTRLSYAYDISTFFDFLRKLKPELEKLSVENISLEQLCAVTREIRKLQVLIKRMYLTLPDFGEKLLRR